MNVAVLVIVFGLQGPGEPRTLEELPAEFVSIRPFDKAMPPPLTRDLLLLSNGDRWPIDPDAPMRIEDDRLSVRLAAPLGSDEVSLSLNYLTALWKGTKSESFFDGLQQSARAKDQVWLGTGDRHDGAILDLDAKSGLRAQGKSWPNDRWVGIALNTELRAKPRMRGAYFHVVLAGGGRITLSDAKLEKDLLMGKSPLGPKLTIPWPAVRSLDLYQSKATYLSDLNPTKYQHEPLFDVTWPLGKNRTPLGTPLRLGLSTFDKGLGMHSPSVAEFDLAGMYRRFEAEVGVDAGIAREGRARIEVLVDGQSKARHDLAPGQSTPLGIDVSRAKTLTLRVESGPFADVQGHVSWGDARVVR